MSWLYAARMDRQVRRLTINAEVTVEVTDADALEAEALRRVAVAEFVADADHSVEDIRAAESDDVRGDVAAALSWPCCSLSASAVVTTARRAPVCS